MVWKAHMMARLLSVLFLVLPHIAVAKILPAEMIALEGQHAFKSGDDMAWAEPEFDDRTWVRTTLPGLWNSEQIDRFETVAWHRVWFTVPESFKGKELALAAYFDGQEEIYLNGQRIGGNGEFAIPGVRPRPDLGLGKMRVYSLPEDSLDRDGRNLIAIRINRMLLGETGGIQDDIFHIADQRDLLQIKAEIDKRHYFIDGIIIAVSMTLFMMTLVIWLSGFRSTLVSLSLALTGLNTIALLAQLHILVDVSWLPVVREHALYIISSLLMILIIEFTARLLGVTKHATGQLIQWAASLNVCLISLILLNVAIRPLFYISSVLSIIIIFATLIWVVYVSIKAILLKRQLGWTMLISFLLTLTIPIFWSVFATGTLSDQINWLGRWPSDISMVLFLMVLATMAGFRVWDMESERLQANARALSAQAIERQRVARDMHDSVGQWLGSIKIRLQSLMNDQSVENASRSQIDELIGDVDVLMDDTRRIARDLSPTLLLRKGFDQAIRDHVNILSEDYGVDVKLKGLDVLDLDSTTEENIYRIIQEACNNAVIHGEASTLDIELGLEGVARDHLQLLIRDNGKGFDVKESLDRLSLGLTSIQERAALLGGKTDISSVAGQGTSIRTTIPVPPLKN